MASISLYLDSLSTLIKKHSHPTMDQAVAGVYVGTNETETSTVKYTLSECRLLNEPCHFGFSGWHNFDLMVQRKSTRGVMADFNPNTSVFMECSLIGTWGRNRHQYADLMQKYVKMNFSKFSPNIKGGLCIDAYEEVKRELTRTDSWLSTDEGYEHIQKLAAAGKVCVITEDIRSHTVFAKIAKILKNNHVAIDTLYLSNISKYMVSSEDKDAYQTTVKHLFTYETKLIHSDHDLCQSVLHGRVMWKQLTKSILFLEKECAANQVPVVEDVTEEEVSQLAESLENTNI